MICIPMLSYVLILEVGLHGVYSDDFGTQQKFPQADPFKDGIKIRTIVGKDMSNHPKFSEFERALSTSLDIWKTTLRPKLRTNKTLLIPKRCEQDDFVQTPDGPHCRQNCSDESSCPWIRLAPSLTKGCTLSGESGPIQISQDGKGLNDTELLLVVDTVPESICSNSLAFAILCAQDPATDRPIFGFVGVCAMFFGRKQNQQSAILTHEIAHILGFNEMVLAYFRDENGEPRTPRNSTTNLPNLGKLSRAYIPSGIWCLMITTQQSSNHKILRVTYQQMTTLQLWRQEVFYQPPEFIIKRFGI
ncbi:hypothetical protein EG68_06746 [Paragonimus skrjabini miyazakii]|uniref:Leishmanolysin-like peptidase n=1 Tax=Paragonimus skrjabini miyazakii TaxID=59628 RepID=A0A8S9YSR3_9TREM|nr:hypothetical protein EG68_06746 [Paragonimus skrjabini miyazakii]